MKKVLYIFSFALFLLAMPIKANASDFDLQSAVEEIINAVESGQATPADYDLSEGEYRDIRDAYYGGYIVYSDQPSSNATTNDNTTTNNSSATDGEVIIDDPVYIDTTTGETFEGDAAKEKLNESEAVSEENSESEVAPSDEANAKEPEVTDVSETAATTETSEAEIQPYQEKTIPTYVFIIIIVGIILVTSIIILIILKKPDKKVS